MLAFAAPTTNSYKRLVPGYEAPVNLVYSQRNRSAACRIPLYSQSPKAKRIEFRCPDPSCNPYLAFPAMLHGRPRRDAEPDRAPGPLEKDLFDLPAAELANVPHMPGSLDEAMDALEADHDFLRAGDVFTDDLLETWIDYKRVEGGATPCACAPTPTSSPSTTTSEPSSGPGSAGLGDRRPPPTVRWPEGAHSSCSHRGGGWSRWGLVRW